MKYELSEAEAMGQWLRSIDSPGGHHYLARLRGIWLWSKRSQYLDFEL